MLQLSKLLIEQKFDKNFFIFFSKKCKKSIDKITQRVYNISIVKIKQQGDKAMYTIKVKHLPQQYKNQGSHKEQCVAYTLTGEIRKHDRIQFDQGSDIPEYNASVKSSHFTLASGKINMGNTLEEKIADYFNRTVSTLFIYVTNEFDAYMMNATEFKQFLLAFGKLERDSKKHGGYLKVRVPRENKQMLQWLATH